MSSQSISPQVAQSLAEKVEAFCKTLTPEELTAFEAIEAQLGALAGDQEADVQGYILNPMTAPEMARIRQEDLMREANRERLASRATRSGDRKSFWQSLLGSVGSREAAAPAPQLRPATGTPTGD
jgi:hypothetical protein